MKLIHSLLIIAVFLSQASATYLFEYWYQGLDWNGTCQAGFKQSPIDIPTDLFTVANPLMIYQPYSQNITAQLKQSPNLNFQSAYSLIVNQEIAVYDKRTVYMNFNQGSIVFIDELNQIKIYQILQLHFHSPSEHTFNGQKKQYDLELHIVHQRYYNNSDQDYVVLAVFFDHIYGGNATNSFIESLNLLDAQKDPTFFTTALPDAILPLPLVNSAAATTTPATVPTDNTASTGSTSATAPTIPTATINTAIPTAATIDATAPAASTTGIPVSPAATVPNTTPIPIANITHHFTLSVNLTGLVEGLNKNNLYHYTGSLTTPPCKESVHWLVVDDPQSISMEQVALFKNKWQQNTTFAGGKGNNRAVQSVNDRVIYKRQDPLAPAVVLTKFPYLDSVMSFAY